ncbi:branched-chain amino acid ABC transporter substrate-binding protein [Stappia sp. BW2]|uniref:branched-chain amino acid ABC transporter substrate-binding protein n=1 Tax=Stappia sp. BW2 TaxID=2592622 RepID=UPI0011DED884|nr:branched-chain amino acid ABC transporter substrate-binding protein [Stappia sp. BW2]TYC65323.1 branched-chain amino acid ABC transporter substrate-binding protein [Stappia sp. BW2]
MTFQQLLASFGLLAFGAVVATPAAADIRIAVAGPMKGQFAAFGEEMRIGAERAVADLNAAGGVNGETLVLEVADDGCDADQAAAVANQLIGKGVVFVAGHLCFNSSIAASEVYAGGGIVQISPATTLPKFTDERPGEGTFRLAPRDDRQADVAARFLVNEFGDQRIALLHDKTAYGIGLTDALKAALNELGTSESMSLGFDAGGDDFRTLVSQLKLQAVDVVYLGGYHPEAGLIKLEMARQGLDAVLMAGDALMTDDYWSVTGNAGNGTLLTYPEIPRERPQAQDFVAALEGAGLSADRFTLTTYAAIQAWAQAVEAGGNAALPDVASALNEGTFDTVIGEVTFNENGDSNLPDYIVYQWQGGMPQAR